MAEIRCPNCGRNNSDLLDVCQFCQTPLKPQSVLHIGEKPTKKNTGELESVLPDWLKDIQQQSKDAAEEDAAQAAANPRPQKNEPPDLLAGLVSQAGSTEEDVPDWLASIRPADKPKASESSAATETSSGSDFFAQFNQQESKPEPVNESPQEEVPSWMGGRREEATIPFEKDELSEWLTQASERPEEVVEPDEQQSELGWRSSFESPSTSTQKAPAEEEDLGWLHNLEAAAKQTGDLQTPKKETDWAANFETPSVPSQSSTPGSGDDLSWLDRLGGIEEASQPERQSEQPAARRDDLSWLDQFGRTPIPPEVSKPVAPEAAPNQPAQPFSVPEEKSASEEDLSWLNNLGKPSEPSAPAAPPAPSEQDLSWLNDLGGAPE